MTGVPNPKVELILRRFILFAKKIIHPILKEPDITILSQIQKAQSIGSVMTIISFILNVFVSRMKSLEFLIIPLIILVSLTIIGQVITFSRLSSTKKKLETFVKT